MAGLTTKQLIAQLRKMPPDAIVVWRDHDQSRDEYNDRVGNVSDDTDYLSLDAEVRYVVLSS